MEILNDEQLLSLKRRYEECKDPETGRMSLSNELKIDIIKYCDQSKYTLNQIAAVIGVKFPSIISQWKAKLYSSKPKATNLVTVKNQIKPTNVDFVSQAKNMELNDLVFNYKKLKTYIEDRVETENQKLNDLKNVLDYKHSQN